MPFSFSRRTPTLDLAECSKKPAAERRRMATTIIEDLCASIRGLRVEADNGSREILREVYNPPQASTEPHRPRKLVKKALKSQLPSPPASPTSPASFAELQETSMESPVQASTPPPQIKSTVLPHVILCYRYLLTHLYNPFPADHIRELISVHSHTPRSTIDAWFAHTRLQTGWDTLLSSSLSPAQRDRVFYHTTNYFVHNKSSGNAQMDNIMLGLKRRAQALYYNDVVLGKESAEKRYPTPEPEPVVQVKKRSRSEEDDAPASPPAKRLMKRKPLGRPSVAPTPISSAKRSRTEEEDEDVPRTAKKARTTAFETPEVPLQSSTKPPSPPAADKKRRRLSDSQTSFVLPTDNMSAKKLLRSVSTPALDRPTSPASIPSPITPVYSSLSPLSYSLESSPKSLVLPHDPRIFDGWFDRVNAQLGENNSQEISYAFARYV